MRELGISGPIFVSIGDEGKLATFLDANPKVPKELMLVDDYSFGAYNSAGFGKLLEDKENTKKGSTKIKTGDLKRLGFKQWLSYAKIVGQVAPIQKDAMKFGEVPEGVTRLGGTMGIKNNRLEFFYKDGVPGDYPDPDLVLKIFKDS